MTLHLRINVKVKWDSLSREGKGGCLEGDVRFWDLLAPHIVFETTPTLFDRPLVARVDLVRMRRDQIFGPELVWNGGANERQARAGQIILDLNARLSASVAARLSQN